MPKAATAVSAAKRTPSCMPIQYQRRIRAPASIAIAVVTLATITLAVLVPMALVTNWFRKGARDTYRKVRVRIAKVNSFLQEHLSGIAVVQLFRREAPARAAFREVNDEHREANLESIFYYAVFYPAIEIIGAAAASLIFTCLTP